MSATRSPPTQSGRSATSSSVSIRDPRRLKSRNPLSGMTLPAHRSSDQLISVVSIHPTYGMSLTPSRYCSCKPIHCSACCEPAGLPSNVPRLSRHGFNARGLARAQLWSVRGHLVSTGRSPGAARLQSGGSPWRRRSSMRRLVVGLCVFCAAMLCATVSAVAASPGKWVGGWGASPQVAFANLGETGISPDSVCPGRTVSPTRPSVTSSHPASAARRSGSAYERVWHDAAARRCSIGRDRGSRAPEQCRTRSRP